jgi:hypothetical protein
MHARYRARITGGWNTCAGASARAGALALVLAGAVGAAGLTGPPASASAAAGGAVAGAGASARAGGGDLYYVAGQFIKRRPVTGGSAQPVVKVGSVSVSGIAKVGSRLFWLRFSGFNGAIRWVQLGGTQTHTLVGKLSSPTGLVTVNGWLYWAGQKAIGRVRPNGTHVARRFIPLPQENGGGVADGLATDGHHLFFSRCQDSEIGRVNPDGSHRQLAFIKLSGSGVCPQALAVGNTHLYWTQLAIGTSGFVGRATLSGTNANDKWLRIRTSQGPFNVAADNQHVYWDWGGVSGAPMWVGRARVNGTGFVKKLFKGQGAFLLTSPGANT